MWGLLEVSFQLVVILDGNGKKECEYDEKKLLLLTLSSSLFIMCAYPVQAKSFAGREEEMNQKCSAIYDEETQRECEEYKAYIQEQNQNLNKDIQNIKSQLSAVGK